LRLAAAGKVRGCVFTGIMSGLMVDDDDLFSASSVCGAEYRVPLTHLSAFMVFDLPWLSCRWMLTLSTDAAGLWPWRLRSDLRLYLSQLSGYLTHSRVSYTPFFNSGLLMFLKCVTRRSTL
jgi:hypothetical protein